MLCFFLFGRFKILNNKVIISHYAKTNYVLFPPNEVTAREIKRIVLPYDISRARIFLNPIRYAIVF